jgi:hypothetical protein
MMMKWVFLWHDFKTDICKTPYGNVRCHTLTKYTQLLLSDTKYVLSYNAKVENIERVTNKNVRS